MLHACNKSSLWPYRRYYITHKCSQLPEFTIHILLVHRICILSLLVAVLQQCGTTLLKVKKKLENTNQRPDSNPSEHPWKELKHAIWRRHPLNLSEWSSLLMRSGPKYLLPGAEVSHFYLQKCDCLKRSCNKMLRVNHFCQGLFHPWLKFYCF